MDENENIYRFLSKWAPGTGTRTAIEKDLPRTFQCQEDSDKFVDSLRRLLIAYSHFNPRVQYVQGMNYIAYFVLRQYFESPPSSDFIIDHYDIYNDDDDEMDNEIESKFGIPDEIEDTLTTDNDTIYTNYTTETDTENVVHFGPHSTSNDLRGDLQFDDEPTPYPHSHSVHGPEDCDPFLLEEQSFWTFAAIMTQIDSLFRDNLCGFHEAVACFRKVFDYHAPTNLVHHVHADKEQDIFQTPIIFTKWYHTLFTHPAIDENIGRRIWDVFITQHMDFAVILKISYLVLIRHKRSLLNMNFMEMTQFCASGRCFTFNGMTDVELVRRANRLQINELFLKPVRNLNAICPQSQSVHFVGDEVYTKKHSEVHEGNETATFPEQRANENWEAVDTLWSYFKMLLVIPK